MAALFQRVVTRSGVTEALQFAQVHLQQFQGEFMPQIKQLMGRLLYSHRAVGDTPYGQLDERALLEEVATDFTKATCRILGQVCWLAFFNSLRESCLLHACQEKSTRKVSVWDSVM